MVSKMHSRKIGEVNIFELEGIFSSPWLNRPREEMKDLFQQSRANGVLFNLRQVEKIDHAGAELILETARKATKGGILGQNLSSYFVAEHMKPSESIPIFEKGLEAIEYFGREFANTQVKLPLNQEKRDFPRLKTALPAEFELKDEGGLFVFETVVLNLSEGGFYGRFLDSKTEQLATRKLDPFDLKLLTVRLSFKDHPLLKMEGKILRTEKAFSVWGGIAIEFYNLETEDREKIRAFLERQMSTG